MSYFWKNLCIKSISFFSKEYADYREQFFQKYWGNICEDCLKEKKIPLDEEDEIYKSEGFCSCCKKFSLCVNNELIYFYKNSLYELEDDKKLDFIKKHKLPFVYGAQSFGEFIDLKKYCAKHIIEEKIKEEIKKERGLEHDYRIFDRSRRHVNYNINYFFNNNQSYNNFINNLKDYLNEMRDKNTLEYISITDENKKHSREYIDIIIKKIHRNEHFEYISEELKKIITEESIYEVSFEKNKELSIVIQILEFITKFNIRTKNSKIINQKLLACVVENYVIDKNRMKGKEGNILESILRLARKAGLSLIFVGTHENNLFRDYY